MDQQHNTDEATGDAEHLKVHQLEETTMNSSLKRRQQTGKESGVRVGMMIRDVKTRKANIRDKTPVYFIGMETKRARDIKVTQ